MSLSRNAPFFIGLLSLAVLISSCALGSKIKNGQMAYERKQYSVATELLTKEYDNTRSKSDQAYKAYLLGQSYTYMGETAEALHWLQISFDKGYGPEVTRTLAKAYKKSGNYKAAIKKYEQLKTQVAGRDQEINREIAVLKQLSSWTENEQYQYQVEILKSSGPDMDYGAAVFEDDFLVFTSDRKQSTGGDLYKWTGGSYSDLYIVPKTSSKPRKFDAILNSKYNDGAACFSADYNEIYFTRCYSEKDNVDATCRIMYSERYTGVWSKLVELPFGLEGYNCGQPALIEEDSVLVFSANLPGTIGGHDLFYSVKEVTDQGMTLWSEPVAMPRSINTQGNEMFPVGDGDTLYFSSDYLAGLGGLDIFKTYLMANGQWATPQNMLSPINSSEDDYSFTIDRTARLRGRMLEKGYFTSTRKGYGYDDLYMYEKSPRLVVLDTTTDAADETEKYLITLAIQSRTPTYKDPSDPNSGSAGLQRLGNVKLSINDGRGEQAVTTDEKGLLILEADLNRNYKILASKPGYLNGSEVTSTIGLKFDKGELSKTINVSLDLPKIFYNQEIVLDKIYYDFNKSNIRDEAKVVLDTLAQLLRANPQIQIELSSHTDCRGDKEYNMILSQKRAQSAVDYLLSKGISAGMVVARGYGKMVPFVSCECGACTEEEHQRNRRTSFKILK